MDISIAAHNGGTGKTTTSISLAAGLARQHQTDLPTGPNTDLVASTYRSLCA